MKTLILSLGTAVCLTSCAGYELIVPVSIGYGRPCLPPPVAAPCGPVYRPYYGYGGNCYRPPVYRGCPPPRFRPRCF